MSGSPLQLAGPGDLGGFSSLTQFPLTNVCPAHVLTDELGLSTKLLEGGDSRPQPGKGGKEQLGQGLVLSCLIERNEVSHAPEACKAIGHAVGSSGPSCTQGG